MSFDGFVYFRSYKQWPLPRFQFLPQAGIKHALPKKKQSRNVKCITINLKAINDNNSSHNSCDYEHTVIHISHIYHVLQEMLKV